MLSSLRFVVSSFCSNSCLILRKSAWSFSKWSSRTTLEGGFFSTLEGAFLSWLATANAQNSSAATSIATENLPRLIIYCAPRNLSKWRSNQILIYLEPKVKLEIQHLMRKAAMQQRAQLGRCAAVAAPELLVSALANSHAVRTISPFVNNASLRFDCRRARLACGSALIGTRVFFVGALGAYRQRCLACRCACQRGGGFSRGAAAGSEQGIDIGCWDSGLMHWYRQGSSTRTGVRTPRKWARAGVEPDHSAEPGTR